jgi:hypothetical protein
MRPIFADFYYLLACPLASCRPAPASQFIAASHLGYAPNWFIA